MKSVLISIQPKWCELIASGKKTVEVRKTKPKLKTPFKVYIYCTKNKRQWLRKLCTTVRETFITENIDVLGRTEKVKSLIGEATFWENGGYNGKVIGEFMCDEIKAERPKSLYASHKTVINCCVPIQEIIDYAGEKNFLYFWHISNLKIYDEPKKLSEFYIPVKDYWETYDPSKYINGCWQKPLQRPPQSWCYVESEDKK